MKVKQYLEKNYEEFSVKRKWRSLNDPITSLAFENHDFKKHASGIFSVLSMGMGADVMIDANKDVNEAICDFIKPYCISKEVDTLKTFLDSSYDEIERKYGVDQYRLYFSRKNGFRFQVQELYSGSGWFPFEIELNSDKKIQFDISLDMETTEEMKRILNMSARKNGFHLVQIEAFRQGVNESYILEKN